MKSNRLNIDWLKAGVLNILLAYAALMLTRVAYALENWGVYAEVLKENSLWDLLLGSLVFDTTTMVYTNIAYVLMLFLPLHLKEKAGFYTFLRWLWLVPNAVAVSMNLMDAAYFPYTGRRTTASVFSEFSNEQNMFDIMGVELYRHWYLVLAGIVLIVAMYLCYRQPRPLKAKQGKGVLLAYYAEQAVCLLLAGVLAIGALRGGFTTATRPITISNANQYASSPQAAALILTTPFSIVRTIGKKVFNDPAFYTKEELDWLYSPLHDGSADSAAFVPRNVVVIICESLGQEYFGFYNSHLDDGKYRGYTPFLDSICGQSLTFEWNFANGRKSIDGMPSVLSSIPMFEEPFFLTPFSMNRLSGLASELRTEGYETAFFHGAQNGSMGFQAFARATGFEQYYGRTEFDADKSLGGDREFDGTWAIWDEPFLQFYAKTMSEMKEPFMTAVFTASSHHPYHIPEAYRDTFPEGKVQIHKCVQYLDHSLRRFFERAKREPWFANTIFVITGDHTNQTCMPGYRTIWGMYSVPVIFYDPSHQLFPAQHRKAVAQQIDIMPTVLSALHYHKPYVAFGCDLQSTPDSLTWMVGYNGLLYQYFQDGVFLMSDLGGQVQTYQLENLQTAHQLPASEPVQAAYEQRLKAIVQSYMQRMLNDELVP